MNNDTTTFNAAALRRLRRDQGMSLAQLAAKAGLTDAAICYIENGRSKRPRPSTVKALADALGTAVSDLWDAA